MRKRFTFWFFHYRYFFLRSFSHSRDSRDSFSGHFSFSGALWERWGSIFHHENGLDHQRCPKRHFPQNPFISLDPFWNYVLWFVFCFLSFVFRHRFLLSTEAECSWMFVSFRHHVFDICLYLSVALVLMVFGNLSIRKPVSYKSKDVKFNTCSTCFVDFVSSSFYVKFRNFLKP